MGKEKIKVLIFDYDGTLVYRKFEPLFRLIKLNKDKREELLRLLQEDLQKTRNLKTTFINVFERFHISYNEEFLAKCVKKYLQIYSSGKIDQKVKKLLKALAKKYTLVILSNGSKRYKIEELKKNGLDKIFDIITPEDCGYEKPSEKAFLFVLKKYKIKPHQAVSIGNSYSFDILPAKKLGIKTIWLAPQADLILNSLEELNEKDLSKL
jgi:putative hydrolase of the HAD superfamily